MRGMVFTIPARSHSSRKWASMISSPVCGSGQPWARAWRILSLGNCPCATRVSSGPVIPWSAAKAACLIPCFRKAALYAAPIRFVDINKIKVTGPFVLAKRLIQFQRFDVRTTVVHTSESARLRPVAVDVEDGRRRLRDILLDYLRILERSGKACGDEPFRLACQEFMKDLTSQRSG